MNYPFFLARRLSLSSSGRRSSPAVKVASAAVALSVSVMLASIAVVTGFKHEITRKVTGFNSDMVVTIAGRDDGRGNVMTLLPSLRSLLDTVPFIREYALQVSVPAVIKTPDDFKGIYLRGCSDEATASFITENLEEGSLPEPGETDRIVIARPAASKLNLSPGDRIDVYFFTDDVRVRRLTVSGIYNSHFDSYDDVVAYAPLEIIQNVAGLRADQGSSLRIGVDDFSHVEEYSSRLQSILAQAEASGLIFSHYEVSTALSAGASYFQWLDLLDTNVVVILTLMMIVGCVTLVGGMLMIILDKKRFIGLMKALGAPSGKLRRVFVWLALRVAVVGMVIGNAVALGILLVQKHWHFLHLDPESYYIDFVPVSLHWLDVVTLNVGVLIVAWLVLILPSRFVAGISPADTMRGE